MSGTSAIKTSDNSPSGPSRRGRSIRLVLLLLIGATVLLVPTRAVRGQWPTGDRVEETFHNLTVPAQVQDSDMAGLIEDLGEVCVYCHASHNGATDRPLWNRFTPPGPYRMYDEPLNMIADPQPTSNTLSCLSCHDGTLGLDEVRDLPNTYRGPGPAITMIDECEDCHSGGNPDAGLDFEGVWFDTDFRKQHPISLLYDPSRDPDFRTVAEVEAAGLKFYDGKLQCMTCHDPHSQRFRPFLRVGNTVGSLCLACHKTQPEESTAHFW